MAETDTPSGPETIRHLDTIDEFIHDTFIQDDVDMAVHDAFDDVSEGITMPAATHILGEDGLPMAVDPGALSGLEMPLHPETLVCMKGEGRPACKHYLRQMLALGNNPEHQQVYRLCMVRQGSTGAFIDVSGGVWACDMRDPPDMKSQKKLDAFDAKKIAEGIQRLSETESVFGTRKG
jgi:hypothetical protein